MADAYVRLFPLKNKLDSRYRHSIQTDIESTVRDQKCAFADIVAKFTTVKEEQNDDPDILDYEISDYRFIAATADP